MIGDTLNDAYTTIEDLSEQAIGEERRKRVLDVLGQKRDEAWRATRRYAARFGLRRQQLPARAGVPSGAPAFLL